MPRLARTSHSHFYLLPTIALVAATIIGAWHTGSSSPAPKSRAVTAPAASESATRLSAVAPPLRATSEAVAAASDATPESIHEPDTEIATLTDSESETARPLPAPRAPEPGPAVPRAAEPGPAEAEVPTVPAEETREIRVRRGAILMNILVKAGVPRIEADRAIIALRPVYDPRGLQVDQILRLAFEVAEGVKDRFVGLYFAPDPDHTIAIELNGDGSYTAARVANSAAARVAGAAGVDGPETAGSRTETAVPAATKNGDARHGESAETASIDPAAPTPGALAPADPARAETMIETPATPRPAEIGRGVRVRRGATLMNILIKAGVSRLEADAAISALRPVYDPRGLQAGQTIQLHFEVAEGTKDRFLGLGFEADVDHSVTVELSNDGSYKAARVARTLSAELVRARGPINTSLFEAGVQAGVPIPVMIQFIQLYSFDVDFQRDIWAGDRFEVMYDSFSDAQGRPVRQGDILYASLSVRGQVLRLYRFTPADGRTDYFNEEGESARKMLMRTPVDGARLSSRYGMRRHPILRYTKMHRGIDFAAPRGTPIYAAGDGTVTRAGRNGAYGRYIRIRHNSTYATTYAHLRGFARGIRAGERVRQGQVIGYVGSSGLSSGPHLHYEILRGGRRINPLKLRMASGERLKGEELKSFMATRGDMVTRFASLARDLGVARNKPKRQHACAGANIETSGTDATDAQGC